MKLIFNKLINLILNMKKKRENKSGTVKTPPPPLLVFYKHRLKHKAK
jgi:hypothetical protein